MANSRNYSNIPNGKLNVIGNIIKHERELVGFSRQVLSDKLMIIGIDIPSSSIYDIEKGTRTIVDYEICAIAKVLKIPTDTLLKQYYNSLDNI